jgi:hypothetical protein
VDHQLSGTLGEFSRKAQEALSRGEKLVEVELPEPLPLVKLTITV